MGSDCSACKRDDSIPQASEATARINTFRREAAIVKQNKLPHTQLFLDDINSDYANIANLDCGISTSSDHEYNTTNQASPWSDEDPDHDITPEPQIEGNHDQDPNHNHEYIALKPASIGTKPQMTPRRKFANSILASPVFHSPIALNKTVDRFSFVLAGIFDNLQDQFTESTQKGWMEKKQSVPPYKWLKRWVIVEQGYILWSDRQITIGLHGVDKKEKKRWNKCIKIKHIVEVSAIKKGKTQRKFRIRVKNKKMDREFIWRAKDSKWRDRWVKDLRYNMSLDK